MTLVSFLLSRVAEDEDTARWVMGWYAGDPPYWQDQDWSSIGPEVAQHVSRHTPQRVLRLDSAIRQIALMTDLARGREAESLDRVLRELAAVYADHADYDEAWRPTWYR